MYRSGERPRSSRPPGTGSGGGGHRRQRPVQNQSPFRRLARTHALIAIGDAAMYGAVAGEVLSLGPDAQRSAVLRYLIVSFAPFVVVAPLIGPTIDRMPQSGLATIRENERSVTSPQAAMICSIGFIDSAKTG